MPLSFFDRSENHRFFLLRFNLDGMTHKIMYGNIAVLAAFAFVYSAFAKRIEQRWLSGPIVFTLFGFLFGSQGLGVLTLDISGEGLKSLAELTLAVVLFNDAANANLGALWSGRRIPRQMLGVGLPLTILLGFGVGYVLFDDLSLFEIAMLATMLAATDAALGKPVLNNKAVPERLREGLNVESGLNDGICVPILFLFIELAASTETKGGGVALAIHLIIEEVGIGLAVAIGIAAIAGWILNVSLKNNWLTVAWQQITVLALSVSCFCSAQALGGSGFIAAFVGGLIFGKVVQEKKHDLLQASEGIGDAFALVTWVVFGGVVLGQSGDYLNWSIILYSVLSLTVVRMLPVFLSLAGTGESIQNKLFLGWFGPRGLASIVFIIIVLDEHFPGGETMATVVVYTVTLSIFAHGLSANKMAASVGELAKRKP